MLWLPWLHCYYYVPQNLPIYVVCIEAIFILQQPINWMNTWDRVLLNGCVKKWRTKPLTDRRMGNLKALSNFKWIFFSCAWIVTMRKYGFLVGIQCNCIWLMRGVFYNSYMLFGISWHHLFQNILFHTPDTNHGLYSLECYYWWLLFTTSLSKLGGRGLWFSEKVSSNRSSSKASQLNVGIQENLISRNCYTKVLCRFLFVHSSK